MNEHHSKTSNESSDSTESFICCKCKQNILVSDKHQHEMYCLYALNTSGFESNSIPCETCGKNISFDEFTMHQMMCNDGGDLGRDILYSMQMSSTGQRIQPRVSIINQIIPEPELINPENNIDSPNTDSPNTDSPETESTNVTRANPIIYDTILNGINRTLSHIGYNIPLEQQNEPTESNVANDFPEPPIYEDIIDTSDDDSDAIDEQHFPELPNTISVSHNTYFRRAIEELGDFGNLINESIPSTQTHSGAYVHSPYSSAYISRYVSPYSQSSTNVTSESLSNIPTELRHFATQALEMQRVNNARRMEELQERVRRRRDAIDLGPGLSSYSDLMALREHPIYGDVKIGVKNIDNVAPLYNMTPKDLSTMICPICRDNYTEDDSGTNITYRKTICKHEDNIFHDKCISRWLKDNRACPICDSNLEEIYDNKQDIDNLDDLDDSEVYLTYV